MKRHNVYKTLSLMLVPVLVATALLTSCKSKNEEPAGHNHTVAVGLAVSYKDESDGTLTCTVADCQGKVLFTKKGLTTKCATEAVSNSVFSLSWLVNNNPGGYESVYFDRLNCLVSEVYAGEQASDGTRLIYTETKDGKVNVMIRDLFNTDGFCEAYALEDAYTGGDYTVLGAQVTDNKSGKISYLVDGEGAHRLIEYNLYPDAKTTFRTKSTKTEEAKKTEKAEKTEK